MMRAHWLWLAAAALPWLAGCGSPIVGGECRPGFVDCDGRCVDTQNDPDHCGSCGESCGDLACHEGSCGPDRHPDAGPDGGAGDPDGGVAGGGGTGGRGPTTGRGSSGIPMNPDGGFMFPDPMVSMGCGVGLTDCGGACADLDSDHDHCGSCGEACGAEQFCANGECVDICEAPLRPCKGACVNFDTDERNCGSCGTVCRSGVCEDGVCADVVPGHLVVIGHDYSTPSNPTMQRIAGSALFLPVGAEVRTLVYRGAADEPSVAGVNDAFRSVLPLSGRTFTPRDVDPAQLGLQLRDTDTLVVHAQAEASDAELLELGQRWGLAMTEFLLRGGVIVVFETESANNAGTFQLLEPAGLFTADSRDAVAPRMRLDVLTPGVGVAQWATNTYRSAPTTVRFLDIQSPANVIVEDPDGEAVVLHRVVVP